MAENTTLRQAIRSFIKGELNNVELYLKEGTISDVNEAAKTVTFTPIDGAPIEDVLINPTLNGTLGLNIIPKDGSTGVIGFKDEIQAFLLGCDEIEKVLLTVGNSTLEVTDGLFEFNGGSNDGMVLITPLTVDLNALVGEINTELGKISAAIAGLGGVYTVNPVSSFNKSNYENTEITQ